MIALCTMYNYCGETYTTIWIRKTTLQQPYVYLMILFRKQFYRQQFENQFPQSIVFLIQCCMGLTTDTNQSIFFTSLHFKLFLRITQFVNITDLFLKCLMNKLLKFYQSFFFLFVVRTEYKQDIISRCSGYHRILPYFCLQNSVLQFLGIYSIYI